MKSLIYPIIAAVGVCSAQAELTPTQTEARQTPTRDFSKVLLAAAKQDGALGLSMAELQDLLGEKDEIKETDILIKSVKWIYQLSGSRRLEVILGGRGDDVGVSLAGLVDGKKVELAWK